MSNLILGIDPAPSCYYGAVYDGQRILRAGVFEPKSHDVNGNIDSLPPSGGWPTYIHWLPSTDQATIVSTLSAFIIETPDPKRGNYSQVRSRAGAVMQTYGQAVKLATQLAATGIPVYTPSREVILQQVCGWHGGRNSGKADDAVREYLAQRGILKAKLINYCRQEGCYPNGEPRFAEDERIFVTEPRYIRNVNHRDAAMASLFPWQDPRNQQYRYKE